ncbi:MAG: VOC family protein [Methylococcaceae bacterium]
MTNNYTTNSMMKIEHIAIWTRDLEGMRNFYTHYFDAVSSSAYYNHSKEFKSYFLSFGGECRVELMEMPAVSANKNDYHKHIAGIAHFAFRVGTREKVDQITDLLKEDGYEIISPGRMTGDGYYESAVFDPEKNRIEILA